MSYLSLPWLVHRVHLQPGALSLRCTSCIRTLQSIQQREASSSSTSSNNGTHTGAVHKHHHHPSDNSSTTQTFITRNGKVKIDLSNRSLIGVHQSRGERAYQEDSFAIHAVDVDAEECSRALQSASSSSSNASSSSGASLAGGDSASASKRGNLPSSSASSNEASSGDSMTNSNDKQASTTNTEQSLYCAVFDGHNGSQVSSFLSSHLHDRLLSVQQSEANSIVTSYRSLGGYMRRYRGGLLSGMVEPPAPRRMKRIERELKVDEERRAREDRGEVDPTLKKAGEEQLEESNVNKQDGEKANNPRKKDYPPWNLLQRLEATFLKTDLEIIETEKDAGSTATVALLHSLDTPRNPFFASEELHLILAHCGDTRALLCTVPDGMAVRLTETHHPEARTETDRLMRIRTGAVTDSFGESRWAGSLANTRAFGDAHYKALGVFSEPQLVSQIISGSQTAFLILLSDGVTEVLSDQEIVDLASRGYSNPTHAAKAVISFAESVGAQDNLTCLIVPLQGWGKVEGTDGTLKRRELRVANYEGRSNRQNRM